MRWPPIRRALARWFEPKPAAYTAAYAAGGWPEIPTTLDFPRDDRLGPVVVVVRDPIPWLNGVYTFENGDWLKQ